MVRQFRIFLDTCTMANSYWPCIETFQVQYNYFQLTSPAVSDVKSPKDRIYRWTGKTGGRINNIGYTPVGTTADNWYPVTSSDREKQFVVKLIRFKYIGFTNIKIVKIGI